MQQRGFMGSGKEIFKILSYDIGNKDKNMINYAL